MKIVHEEILLHSGRFADSAEWKKARKSLHAAIRRVEWPAGSGSFTIFPESGKRSGEGNGVRPIKEGLLSRLRDLKWKANVPVTMWAGRPPGNYDAVLSTSAGDVVLEWETGNISSSHRSLNKMALGTMKHIIAGGVLIVPSRAMYMFLTDRVGNFAEIEPYLEMWKSLPCSDGVLEIVVIEHDAVSTSVPRIPKGSDGWAKLKKTITARQNRR